MATKANEFPPDQTPLITEDATTSTTPWSPLFWLPCSFGPAVFTDVMLNLIKNPNINSSWLFRADILRDEETGREEEEGLAASLSSQTHVDYPHQLHQIPSFSGDGFECKRCIVRRLVPRNVQRDDPLDQTCLIYEKGSDGGEKVTLVVYLPHVEGPEDVPFYHPKVKAIGFLHRWSEKEGKGTVSISYLFFPGFETAGKVTRTAMHLLAVIHKHGEGRVKGYVKRVNHDVLIPQAVFQDRYAVLKQRYAKGLIDGWAESTDPVKHVFEDLGIAAFLIELWGEMYAEGAFPGFVDIGCGNGLLVYILNREGYRGWGFDARARKSWEMYNSKVDISSAEQDSLRQAILVPSVVRQNGESSDGEDIDETKLHNGVFPAGTFIISNHADELTPWTPILATVSRCPFVMIPCCSHNLTGAKYRAPPPKDKSKSESAYSSLVAWVENIGRDCGWEMETEMLRIPSTRNTALLGRKRIAEYDDFDAQGVISKYGGTEGFLENALKLAKASARGH